MKRHTTKPDYPLLLAIIVLLMFGIVMVYDASVVYAYDVFGGKYHFLLLQASWVLIGVAVFLFTYNAKISLWERISLPLFLVSLFFLILVLIPTPFAPEVYGARRWIVLNPGQLLPAIPLLGRVSFQPTDLAKFSFILYLSSVLTSIDKRGTRKRSPLILLTLLFVLGGLIILEPDFGTTMLITATGVLVYFISGAPFIYFLAGVPAIIATALGFIFSSPYRKQRLLTFLNPDLSDPLSVGYHAQQIAIALGSGGLTGIGLGQSRQKYGYLPEVTADSIFAIIGEELGLVGALLLVALFVFIIYRGFSIAKRQKDKYTNLLAAGITSIFMFQVFLNLSAMVRLVPLTGVPLPLVSYGGSSMIFTLAGLGILLKISRK